MLAASARNIAWLVHELLVVPDGVPVAHVTRELGVADRTYRKYRAFLQYHFEPFQRPDGSSRVVEEVRNGERWLVLRPA